MRPSVRWKPHQTARTEVIESPTAMSSDCILKVPTNCSRDAMVRHALWISSRKAFQFSALKTPFAVVRRKSVLEKSSRRRSLMAALASLVRMERRSAAANSALIAALRDKSSLRSAATMSGSGRLAFLGRRAKFFEAGVDTTKFRPEAKRRNRSATWPACRFPPAAPQGARHLRNVRQCPLRCGPARAAASRSAAPVPARTRN